MKIAFLGGGNMATALIGGLIAKGHEASRISVIEMSPAAREKLGARYPVRVTTAPDDAMKGADTLVLAVKPQDMKRALASLGSEVRGALVISVAAGITLETLSRWLGGHRRIVRCMPNTPALYGVGITAMYPNAAVTARQRALAESVLAGAGEVVWVQDEAQLDAVTAVSGSGPAYYFYVLEAMQRAARTLGLDVELARKLSLATAHGAAVMARESRDDAAQLRKNVTSPGGTTERAISVLDARGVGGAFEDAIVAAAARSRELAAEAGKS